MKTRNALVSEHKESETSCDPLKRVGPAGMRILGHLVNQYDEAEDESWLHAYALHKKAGVTYPAVWAFLVGLKKAGLVEVKTAKVDGRTRKLYRLNEKGHREAAKLLAKKAIAPKSGRAKATAGAHA